MADLPAIVWTQQLRAQIQYMYLYMAIPSESGAPVTVTL